MCVSYAILLTCGISLFYFNPKNYEIPSVSNLPKTTTDILLLSRMTKQIVFLELTVPWEERIGEAHERKKAKCKEDHVLNEGMTVCFTFIYFSI